MTHSWLDFINSQCPLDVRWAAWEDPTLVLRGEHWSFTTTSSWRLLADQVYLRGCEDEGVEHRLNEVAGGTIVRAEAPSTTTSDVRLYFRDGHVLEVFVATCVEPWILRLPQPPTLVPVPGVDWFTET